jgi:hypothetical protein
MMRFFLGFLRDCYEVADEQVRLSVNGFLNNGKTLEEIEGGGWSAWTFRRVASRRRRSTTPFVRIEGNSSTAGVRDGSDRRQLHPHRAEHLRRHPAVRRHRAAGVADLRS